MDCQNDSRRPKTVRNADTDGLRLIKNDRKTLTHLFQTTACILSTFGVQYFLTFSHPKIAHASG